MAEHPKRLREWLDNKDIDKVIFVSQWHRDLAKSIKDHECYVIPNGTYLYDVGDVPKRDNRLIWSSNAVRGLKVVVYDIFPELKKIIPDIELHVAGGNVIYNCSKSQAESKDKNVYSCLYENGKLKDGVFHHGALTQVELARFNKSGTLMIFPLTNRSETGSICTVQAMANLTPVIARNRCVLPELVGNRGVIIDENANNKTWVDTIVEVLRNKKKYQTYQDNCLKWRNDYLWSNITKRVEKDFKEFLA